MTRLCLLASVFCLCFLQIHAVSVVTRDSRPSHDQVVACYVSSWATYRKDNGQFSIENIDPTLCTHLIYAFAGLNSTTSTIRSLDPFNDLEEEYGKGSYKKMTAMKKKYPHLTVSIAIGGWNEGSVNYSKLAADPDQRRLFVDSVVKFLSKYEFNGFDLDWEFPAKRGGATEDKANFVELVKDLHGALSPKGWTLSAALGAGKDTMEAAYDLPQLNKYLDHVHLMCYDYHGKWDNQTGANSPLHSTDPNDVNTVEFSVNYMLEHGIEPHKLVMGVPMYGRTFHLEDETQGEQLGAVSLSSAFRGPYTQEEGFMGYNEICVELQESNSTWKRMWDEATLTPFAKKGHQIIVYDDKESLKHKVKFAMEKHLGGVMIWSIDTDDFRGNCTSNEGGKQKYQLLNSINEAIVSSLKEIEKSQSDSTTKQPTNKIDEPSTASIASVSTVLLMAAWGSFLSW